MSSDNVYHPGELAVQRLAGAEAIAEQNGRMIKSRFPKGAAVFLSKQTLIIASSIDKNGNVWCSMLTGNPGFIELLDEVTMVIDAVPVEGDPLIHHLGGNPNLGLLAIDLYKKSRLRMNGQAVVDSDHRLVINIEQVYGNCPKYIQRRTALFEADSRRVPKLAERSSELNAVQSAQIRNADTFFIGSIGPEGNADASHRGGPPGFVKTLDERTLLFPDYYGNSMFNTLGNIYCNPSTGLLLVDFDNGHYLQLTGRSEIIWEDNEISRFPGAERLVRFEIDEVLYIEQGTNRVWVIENKEEERW